MLYISHPDDKRHAGDLCGTLRAEVRVVAAAAGDIVEAPRGESGYKPASSKTARAGIRGA